MLDLILFVVLLLAGVIGWQRGLLASALGLFCFVIGLVLGFWFAPVVLTLVGMDQAGLPARTMVQLLVVLVVVSVLTATGEWVAHVVMGVIGVPAVRLLDSLLGVVASVVVTALVLWLLAAAVRPVMPQSWAEAVAGSRVLGIVQSLVPPAAHDIPGRFRSTLQAGFFPDVFGDGAEPRLEASPPSGSQIDTEAVRAAESSVLRIRSGSAQCLTGSSGSGWTVAPQRVVTNAHVVAGGSDITVQVGGRGSRLDATVVAYDAGLDLAILAVPGLDAAPLPRTGSVEPGSAAAVLGFPGGGGYTVTPARVGSPLQAYGRDIYNDARVQREIYPLRADVRSGDSGGPVLTAGGEVAGTVFARSTDQAQTGYALTDRATATLLDQAGSLAAPVSTGACQT